MQSGMNIILEPVAVECDSALCIILTCGNIKLMTTNFGYVEIYFYFLVLSGNKVLNLTMNTCVTINITSSIILLELTIICK